MDRYAMPQPRPPRRFTAPTRLDRRRDILQSVVLAGVGSGLLALLMLLLPLLLDDENVLCFVPPLWSIALSAGAGMAAAALLRDKGHDDRRSEAVVGVFAGLIAGFFCGMFMSGAFAKALENMQADYPSPEFSDPNVVVFDANSVACCAGFCGGVWAFLGAGLGTVGSLVYGLLDKHVFSRPGEETGEARGGSGAPTLPPSAPAPPSLGTSAYAADRTQPPREPELVASLLETAQRAEERAALARMVREDPNNERAWLRLAACLDDPQKKRFCLQRVLEIDPGNEAACRMLAEFDGSV